MHSKRVFAVLTALILCAAPTLGFDIDRKSVRIQHVEFPRVSVEGLDFSSVRVEVAFGEVSLGDPVLKTTKSYCVPDGSKSLKDVIELPTYYYEIPYRMPSGVMVIRDGNGELLHAAKIDGFDSYERFGHNKCRYWVQKNLEDDFTERALSDLREKAGQGVRESFQNRTAALIDDALFFNVVEEKVPVYTFKDKVRDYTDLNNAASLARTGYDAIRKSGAEAGRNDLQQAISIWEQALVESNVNDKTARINRKVTVKLQESIGAAWITLGDPARAVTHLQKASRASSMTTSRSDGTGTSDLLQRATERKARVGLNDALRNDPVRLDAVMRETNGFRGKVPVTVLYSHELARLRDEYRGFVGRTIIETMADANTEHEAAVASGEESRYERMVGQTAVQGYFLFLMPYPEKLDAFPHEVCELTHLNRLRIPNHNFGDLPEEIGNLTELEVLDLSGNQIRELPTSIRGLEKLKKLDLSGNRIESLPEEIGQLKNLKVLQLKGNPLAPGEVQRLKKLLPRCKIKGQA